MFLLAPHNNWLTNYLGEGVEFGEGPNVVRLRLHPAHPAREGTAVLSHVPVTPATGKRLGEGNFELGDPTGVVPLKEERLSRLQRERG